MAIDFPTPDAAARHPHPPTDPDEMPYIAYYLLSGEMRIAVGETLLCARSGDLLRIPRGTAPALRTVTPSTRFLVFKTPDGAADFFSDLGSAGRLPGADLHRTLAIARRHGVTPQGPGC